MRLNNRSGLTLIEIVIAMTLSVVIFVILFAALRLGYKSQEKGTDMAEVTQKIRIINDRVAWLIRGVYPFVSKKPEEQKVYFSGKADEAGFVTTSVDTYGKGPEDAARLKWVSIYTDNEGLKIREKVFFLEDVFDDSGGREFLLDPEVKKIEFHYYDVPEDEKSGDWVSDWDPSDRKYFPEAVKVRITFEHKGKTLAMPEMIVKINVRKRAKL